MTLPYDIAEDWFGVKEVIASRGGSIDAFTLGESTRVFIARTADTVIDESWALFHPDIPARRAPHPTRGGLFVASKAAINEAHGIWRVTVTYNQSPRAELPWLEPPVWSWNQQSTEVIVDYDIDGKPILNSAKQPFDPGVTATHFEPTLCISRNVLNYDAALAMKYVGAVNSKPFYGAPKGFARCVGIPATSQIYQNEQGMRVPYWSLQYLFAFRNKFTFQTKIMDAGYYELIDNKLSRIILPDGREPACPVPLKDGRKIEPDAEPKWLDFKTLFETDLYQLGV